MTPELLLALVAYAFVSSITPGPNNAMVLASGTNFGLRATLPHVVGINLGFGFMVIAVGLGIGALFEAFPPLQTALRWGGAIWLCWLAWKIANAGGADAKGRKPRPMTFFEAAGFQWINPKAWVMSIGAVAAYVPHQGFFTNILLAGLVFAIISFPATMTWTIAGTALRQWLSSPLRLRTFNISMALLLVLSLVPVLFVDLR